MEPVSLQPKLCFRMSKKKIKHLVSKVAFYQVQVSKRINNTASFVTNFGPISPRENE